ncbi:hypothetical protein DFP72DRAFT_461831 [Ephemerocybe angulata]|uniref:Nephrocystin 3-like N-terminal domain-containing protein n=1 Tax=Ephemerocybe angulata TaxID=980116 RepID=A0A8H6M3P5_9AGAR|nr:hypothetical protein DFP72DRAFT_461831 [Tulosesus angulatus]
MVDSSPLQFQCSTANCQDCSADYFAGSLLDLLIIHRKSLSVLANPSMEPSDGDRLVQFQCLARTQQETQQLPQHPDFHPCPQSPYFAVANRRGLLDEITTWAASDPTIDTTSTGDAPSSAQSIYWLYGSVGSGKSYLAREAAESVAREGNNQTATTYILSSGRGTPGWFKESTINISADQRTRSPSTDTLARVQQVSIQMLSNHFDSVIEPWRSQISLPTPDSASGHNLFLVIDIDECEDSDCVLKFVKGALEHVANNPEERLRILVTGRLDDELQALLESSRSTLVRHLDDAASDAELASYLDSRFRKANDEIVLTSAREDWEWESVRSRLVNRSQGSLIFATTLADFLFEDGGLIYQRLDLLLEIDPNLDTLYTKHLALSQDIPNFIEVVTAIALTHCPLSIPGLANLLGLEFSAVLNVLLPLNSIIHVPGDTKDPVRPFHSALRHFLMDKGRSGRYFAQPSFHGRLARKCMEFLAASKTGSQRESELLLYAQTYCTKHYTQYWNTLPPDAQRNASSTLTYVLHTFPSR